MKTRILLVLAALVFGILPCAADTNPGDHLDMLMAKAARIDMLTQLLPLLLSKEQLAKILPAIEKARTSARKTVKLADESLSALEPDVDKMIDAGQTKAVYPSQTGLDALTLAIGKNSILFEAMARSNTADVEEVVRATLNKGQLKTMAMSLRPELFVKGAEADKMSDDEKVTFYVRYVLLNPLAYDILVKLSIRKE